MDAEALLDGMLAKDRLLDLVENFILFDDSKPGGTRKIVARNHQVLGVNNAVASVVRQEELKRRVPARRSGLIEYRVPKPELLQGRRGAAGRLGAMRRAGRRQTRGDDELPLVKRAHPDLGRLGVFWHTQGSGKSYSMAFFAEKVRRVVPGNFTFLVMTDREDLDDQICAHLRRLRRRGREDARAPAPARSCRSSCSENHRFVFSLIHKFNQPVTEPYSERDDIIVISDEAHRTQAGKFARNMRLALPNASFIGFTGTPLFKHDQLTRRIFGDYVSRYDFKRSEEDESTVKLVYENRGEKLGIARLDLNDRIADAIEKADLDPDQAAPAGEAARQGLRGHHRRRPAGQAGRRTSSSTARRAGSPASRCWSASTRSPAPGCSSASSRAGRRSSPRSRRSSRVKEAELAAASRRRRAGAPDKRARLRCAARRSGWRARSSRSSSARRRTRSRDFQKWGFDIIPHRVVMKTRLRDPGRQAGGRRGRLQGPAASVPRRHRLRHVADRLRRGVPVDALHRQADEGAHADAGHRPRQPRLSRARTAA